MTEAQLREYENQGGAIWDDFRQNNVLELVAEVRRLRGLIATLRFSEPVEGVLQEDEPGADWRGLLAEARAIREESKP